MNSQEILNDFNQSADDLLQTLSRFSNDEFNRVPFEGSWTAGQVAEHVLKSASGVPHVLGGSVKETEREADALIPTLTSIFLDFSTKLQSPDFIIPSDGPHDKDEMIAAMTQTMEKIKSTASTTDLNKTCTSFPFPQMGEMTGLEWLFFSSSHSKRHTNQLKNIYRKLNGE
jgi:uncharacterized damage-inducible protein DinB